VDTRTFEQVIPADPAEPNSISQIVQQPGQVWFPNSAFKTAQAIKDFNNEKLPLFIFANWRGFSGGMRDMFNEILKFGSYIVDNLRTYNQPILVYLPPWSELRGGAWVVVDPTINPDMMEMYADDTSRGGVLEPEGTVEIKYREKDLLMAMERLDKEYASLLNKLKNKDLSAAESNEIERSVIQRKQLLLPIYKQVAIHFSDLHDTPGRMKAKGVILDKITWKDSRRFFVRRLMRRLEEHKIILKIRENDQSKSFAEARIIIAKWFIEKNGNKYDWEADNEAVTGWLQKSEGELNNKIESEIKKPALLKYLINLSSSSNPATVNEVVSAFIKLLPTAQQEEIKKTLDQPDK